MENQKGQEKAKIITIKTLAIIGFIATFVLLLWVAVQAVRVLPEAFSSLASLAESLQDYDRAGEFKIEAEKDVVNSGEPFQITWSEPKQEGNFLFSYACTEGVGVEIESADAGRVPVDCNESLSLPETVTGLMVTVTSQEQRFVDVPFSVTFESSAEDGDDLGNDTKITIVNATISQDTLAGQDSNNSASVIASTDDNEEANDDRIPATQVPYTGLTEDPDGYSDLAIRLLEIESNIAGRVEVRFAVENVGTKTSDTWSFRAHLPANVIYDADAQAQLIPGGRVDFNLGFDTFNISESAVVSIELSGGNDNNPNNNSFGRSVFNN